jgi:GxxExxY protein
VNDGQVRAGARAMDINDVTGHLIGMAIEIHRVLGPGLFEHTYEDCLELEMSLAGFKFARQAELHMVYKTVHLPRVYRADFIVENAVVVEVKSIDRLLSVHNSQVLTYLRASGCHVGLILNFNTHLMKQGIRRLVS